MTGARVGIQAERHFKDVLGVRTGYYYHRADGPLLVLMHGSSPGACSDLNWYRNFDALARAGHHILAFDQPGFGHSPSTSDPSIEFRYQHAKAMLLSLQLNVPIFLLGNSMGGLLAVLLQHRVSHSELPIEGMILAAPFPHFAMNAEMESSFLAHRARLGALTPTFDHIKKICSNTFYNQNEVTDGVVQLRLSMLDGHNWEAFQARAAMSDTFDADSVRSQPVQMRTLIVWGLNDRSLPPAIGVQAMDHFEDATFLFLPRAGHWPQTEHADTFNRAVSDFIASS